MHQQLAVFGYLGRGVQRQVAQAELHPAVDAELMALVGRELHFHAHVLQRRCWHRRGIATERRAELFARRQLEIELARIDLPTFGRDQPQLATGAAGNILEAHAAGVGLAQHAGKTITLELRTSSPSGAPPRKCPLPGWAAVRLQSNGRASLRIGWVAAPEVTCFSESPRSSSLAAASGSRRTSRLRPRGGRKPRWSCRRPAAGCRGTARRRARPPW